MRHAIGPKVKRRPKGHWNGKCKTYFRQKWISLSRAKTNMINGIFYTYRQIHFTSRNISFLADRTNGRAYATVLRLSVVCL